MSLSVLDSLEAESIAILREVHGAFARPALLFSGGKDSTCLLHLAALAFSPGPFPFPLLQIETGEDFPEILQFRDRAAARYGARLMVKSVEELIAAGTISVQPGESRNLCQIPALLQVISENRFDAVIGGARRDEERARAKERIFSLRRNNGGWDPGAQRAEIWDLYNTLIGPADHLRIFPLSNWTEGDIWDYVEREKLELAPLYYSHRRRVEAAGGLLYDGPGAAESVRARTVGDRRSTTFISSTASTVEEIRRENAAMNLSERATRADDKYSPFSMEQRKRAGYF